MATSKKAQNKAGVPQRRRGQQMGDERSRPDKIDEAQRVITPSVPAAAPTKMKIGESGGEAEFKARQKTTRKAGSKKPRRG